MATSAEKLPVAAAQAESVSGDVAANVAAAVRLVAEAAGNGARLVVLPELFLTGYDPGAWNPDGCITPDDPRLDSLREVAREHSVVVVVGAGLDRSTRHTLSLLVFASDGTTSAPYDKQHLFAEEAKFFDAGDHGATLELDGWDLALGVCYDGCFPEHAASAAASSEGRATAYLCPSAYYTGAEHRRDLYYAARALDNGIYVVFSGLTGRCGDRDFGGGSAIYDPEGRPVQRVGDASPAIVYADLDPAEVARVQEQNPIGRDRLDGLGPRQRLTIR
jgi:predicted amidohydrolase